VKEKDEIKSNIMAAALIEFGKNGYRHASTNNIHRIAGIAKGTLFYYFKSKAKLYNTVLLYCLDEFIAAMKKAEIERFSSAEEKIAVLITKKMAFYRSHRYESMILFEALTAPPVELSVDFKQSLQSLNVFNIENLLENIDLSDFSPEYGKDEIIRFINYGTAGLQSVLFAKTIDWDNLYYYTEESLKFIKTILKGMKK